MILGKRLAFDMIINCYGGPKHGKRFNLEDERVAFLRCEGGHYGRVQGGIKEDFYWKPYEPPMAVLLNGRLQPVFDKSSCSKRMLPKKMTWL